MPRYDIIPSRCRFAIHAYDVMEVVRHFVHVVLHDSRIETRELASLRDILELRDNPGMLVEHGIDPSRMRFYATSSELGGHAILFRFGRWGRPRVLFCDGEEPKLGETEISLAPIHPNSLERYLDSLDMEQIFHLAACLRIPVRSRGRLRRLDEIITDLVVVHTNDPVFFVPAISIPPDVLNEFVKDIDRVLDDALTEGYRVDERVKAVLYPQVVTFSARNPREVMKYQSHALVITPTKTGKSSTATNVAAVTGGRKEDKTTSAGIVGYAAAGGERRKGSVHGLRGPVFLDEFSDFPEKTLRHVLSLLETGETGIDQAGQYVVTKTFSAFVFLSNPKRYGLTVAEDLITLLGKLTDNIPAFFTRLAVVLISDDIKKTERERYLSPDDTEKAREVVRCILFCLRPVFSAIFQHDKVQRWLEQPITPYRDLVEKELAKHEDVPDMVKDIWLQRAEAAFRHQRGLALKAAILRNIQSIWKVWYEAWENAGRPPDVISVEVPDEALEGLIPLILEAAESELSTYLKMDLDSLDYMLEKRLDYADALAKLLETKPQYVQTLVLAIGLAKAENPSRESVLLSELASYHARLKAVSVKLASWRTLMERATRVREGTLARHLEPFGIKVRALGADVEFAMSELPKHVFLKWLGEGKIAVPGLDVVNLRELLANVAAMSGVPVEQLVDLARRYVAGELDLFYIESYCAQNLGMSKAAIEGLRDKLLGLKGKLVV